VHKLLLLCTSAVMAAALLLRHMPQGGVGEQSCVCVCVRVRVCVCVRARACARVRRRHTRSGDVYMSVLQ
jgi:hypothetical protein